MTSQDEIIHRLRSSFSEGKTRDIKFRISQLEALGKFLEENGPKINESLKQDLNKPAFEVETSELSMVRSEINLAINNLSSWMKDEHVSKSLATYFDSAFIRKDPYGVVLIIGTWNYPVQLTLVPMVGAIAAGNCVVLKPSEISQNTERLLADHLPRYLDKDCFAVICGAAEQTSQLLEHRFDHIFYTGNQTVGKIIMAAAAKYLTPVTLELGGKNPCYVDEDCDMKNAGRRIAWMRFFNAGQTCLSPDYVLCTEKTMERLLEALRRAVQEFYGEDPKQSPDLSRIVNERHFHRVSVLLNSGKIVIGGQTDPSEKYIAPTVLVDVKESDPVMQEEIFGPILPILTVGGLDEAIAFINQRERPLAAYVFSSNTQVINQFLDRTSSGGFCANDGLIHSTLMSLPFGGIGDSGMGNYHGKFSFDTFSHHRACLVRSDGREKLNEIRYPPYTQRNLEIARYAMEVKKKGSCVLM
ncbi:aldehyde dehydrogenase family 3 member B1-like isoform 1-T2 [Rhinophrynus dorsalis]